LAKKKNKDVTAAKKKKEDVIADDVTEHSKGKLISSVQNVSKND